MPSLLVESCSWCLATSIPCQGQSPRYQDRTSPRRVTLILPLSYAGIIRLWSIWCTYIIRHRLTHPVFMQVGWWRRGERRAFWPGSWTCRGFWEINVYIRSTSTFISFTLRHQNDNGLSFVKNRGAKRSKQHRQVENKNTASCTREGWVRSSEPRRIRRDPEIMLAKMRAN